MLLCILQALLYILIKKMKFDESYNFEQEVRKHFYSRPVLKKFFFYFSTKTYVVGTQKNRLNETVLLSTQNIC